MNDMGAAYTPEEWDAWTERMKSAHGNGNGHALAAIPVPPPQKAVAASSTTLAFENSADAPSCHQCGHLMVRNGACYKCLNCGETSGCS